MIDPDVEKRVKELDRICRQRGWTVALAESCTGGLLSSWITAFSGVSSFYMGAVVSYARSVKADVLGVSPAALKAYGEVSLPVASQMAEGARDHLRSTWAVSVTGVAGPSGGSPEKPVGFVCFAVVGPGFEKAVSKQFDGVAPASRAGTTNRQDIQRQAALFAFDFLLNAMR